MIIIILPFSQNKDITSLILHNAVTGTVAAKHQWEEKTTTESNLNWF